MSGEATIPELTPDQRDALASLIRKRPVFVDCELHSERGIAGVQEVLMQGAFQGEWHLYPKPIPEYSGRGVCDETFERETKEDSEDTDSVDEAEYLTLGAIVPITGGSSFFGSGSKTKYLTLRITISLEQRPVEASFYPPESEF